MKRAWMLAMAVTAAVVGFAPEARAGDDVEVVDASRVTYYLDLGGMPDGKSEALVALLKSKFPAASVELIDGTLRVQTDGATFEGLQKLLEAQRLDGLPAPDKKEGERKIKRERVDKKDVFVEEQDGKPFMPGAKPQTAAESKVDAEIVAIHEYLKRLGRELGAGAAKSASGEPAMVRVKVGELCEGCADCLAAALGHEFPRLKFVPDDAEVAVVADPAGQAAVQAWLSGLRTLAKAAPGDDENPEGKRTIGRDDVEQHLEALRAALGGMHRDEAGLDLGALRERMEDLRVRLEGAKDRRPGRPGADKPRDPRAKEQPQGPMAKWRMRIQHLQQAVEHLNAAGFEELAKQAAQAVEVTKKQAEEVAAKLRAAEEAQQAERRKAAERKRLEDEEAKAREHKRARVEAGMEREGGDDLTALIRRLHQQVEELRKEVRELRERVGDRR